MAAASHNVKLLEQFRREISEDSPGQYAVSPCH